METSDKQKEEWRVTVERKMETSNKQKEESRKKKNGDE